QGEQRFGKILCSCVLQKVLIILHLRTQDQSLRQKASGSGRKRPVLAESVWFWQKASGSGRKRLVLAESVGFWQKASGSGRKRPGSGRKLISCPLTGTAGRKRRLFLQSRGSLTCSTGGR